MFARAGSIAGSMRGSVRRKRKPNSPPSRRDSKQSEGGHERMETLAELVSKMKAGESNLLVVSRVRPLSNTEKASGEKEVARIVGGKVVILLDPNEDADDVLRKHRSREKRYAFDQAFGPTATQTEVYEKSCKFLLEGVLNGYNATVFAYGATGAGKTFTMAGTEAQPGVMAMTISDLFALMEVDNSEVDYRVTVSYIELYNEAIRDLLIPDSPDLELREDADGNSVVCGMQRITIESAGQMMNLLQTGNRRRTQESTRANAASSRSHAILEVQVDRSAKVVDKEKVVHSGRLFMIDLAGSERAASTMNNGQRMVEGQHINRSLLALGNCINSLGTGNRVKYVNFRDSKLTRILKPSLGGNCRTVMIACISSAGKHFEESYNTMNYANRAKNIKTTVMANEAVVSAHVAEYGKIIEGLRDKVSYLQGQLQLTHEARPYSSNASAATLRELEEACQQQVMTRKKLELVLLKENDLAAQREVITRKFNLASEGGADLPGKLSKKELKLEEKTLDGAQRQNQQSQSALTDQSEKLRAQIERLSKLLESTPAQQHSRNLVKIHDLEIQNLKLSFAATAQRKEVANRVLTRNGDLRDRIIAEQKILLEKYMTRPPTPLGTLYEALDGQRKQRASAGSSTLSLSTEFGESISGRQSKGKAASTRNEGAPPSGRRLSFDASALAKSRASSGSSMSVITGGPGPAQSSAPVSKSRVRSGAAAPATHNKLDRDSSHSSIDPDGEGDMGDDSGGDVFEEDLSQTYSKAELLSRTYSKEQMMELKNIHDGAGGANSRGNIDTDVPSRAISRTYSKAKPIEVDSSASSSVEPPVSSEPGGAEVSSDMDHKSVHEEPLALLGKAAGTVPPWQRGIVPPQKPKPQANKVKLRGAKPRMGQQRRNPRAGKGTSRQHTHVQGSPYGSMLGLSIQNSPYAPARKARGARKA